MKKKLFINETPLICAYPEYGNLFSILDMEDGKTKDWLLCSFIQIFVSSDKNDVNEHFLGYQEHFCYRENVPTLQYFRLPTDVILASGTDSIVDCFLNYLDKGYYIFCPLNHFHIRNYDKYHTEDFKHMTFFYGYDRQRQVFYIRDNNLHTGKYGSAEYTFEDVHHAYRSFSEKRHLIFREEYTVSLVKKIDHIAYSFHTSYLIKELKRYLGDTATHNGNDKPDSMLHYEIHRTEINYWNLDVYDFLIAHSSDPSAKKQFYFMSEHKALMVFRIQCLMEKGIISGNDLTGQFETVAGKMRTIMLSYLKMLVNQNMNPKVVKKLQTQLAECKKLETEAVSALIQQLESVSAG